jgi:hypothetical protein
MSDSEEATHRFTEETADIADAPGDHIEDSVAPTMEPDLDITGPILKREFPSQDVLHPRAGSPAKETPQDKRNQS